MMTIEQTSIHAYVKPFLLAPFGSNLRERARKKDLLQQRNNYLRPGVEEIEVPAVHKACLGVHILQTYRVRKA